MHRTVGMITLAFVVGIAGGSLEIRSWSPSRSRLSVQHY